MRVFIFILLVFAMLFPLFYVIWLEICVNYLDKHWEHYVRIASEYNLKVSHGESWAGTPWGGTYFFISSDINIEVGPRKALRLFEKLRENEITKEECIRISTWPSCKIPTGGIVRKSGKISKIVNENKVVSESQIEKKIVPKKKRINERNYSY